MENKSTFATEILKELAAEAPATRKCLEVIPADLSEWKPHEKSMKLGYLTLLVAEIPKWITTMIEKSELDFATYEHFQAKNTAELVKHFDENIAGAKNALQNVTEETLAESFDLKNQGQVVYSAPKKDFIGQTINHLVHHRGQLTVFMRLKDIPVPSIYGPSADDKGGF
ncbi:MAG: damage-inducible protein DinB [Acidobacteria bacterium]|nr:damage-inducible protein DinB [Acidobacteriota bacterium]